MSPRTEKQYQEIREEKRKLIKDKALELFALEGFDKSSISKIAKRAGISKGLLYNYFDSKEALLTAIIFEQVDIMMSFFDTNKDGVLEKHEMEYFIRQTFKLLKENPEFWKLYFMLAFQPNVMKLVEEKFMDIVQPMLERTNEFFKREGYQNPEVWTRYLGAILDGISLNYVVDPNNFPLDEIENLVVKQICGTNK
ncbi:MAG: TetR/AcrR family transcriptional regulator [Bacteroidales bacterium]|nr:TetR/AcrR family transcriptional regulator [Bacteroidales bacterium]MCF8336749.1 TetR/AcrR family transcriptional regulator [Bacteroidales bacterium]